MDVPAQPALVDLTIAGATVPALVETTKQGELFVLDRRTGKPVLPVTEVPAPQGAVKGDVTAPTQPVSAIVVQPDAADGILDVGRYRHSTSWRAGSRFARCATRAATPRPP